MEREGEEDQDKDGWTHMYRSRRRDISPIPQTIAEIDLSGVWRIPVRITSTL